MTKNETNLPERHLCQEKLTKENIAFKNTRGRSQENHSLGFSPAFFDSETKKIYVSRNKDGSRAAIHILNGLPDELAIKKDSHNDIILVKPSVISGFLKNEQFYTREEAANLLP